MNRVLTSMNVAQFRRLVSQSYVAILILAGSMIIVGCINPPSNPTEQDTSVISPEREVVELEATKTRVTDEIPEGANPVEEIVPTPTTLAIEGERVVYGITNQNPDGNRWILGQGRLPDASPLEISLKGEPIWVVGAAKGEGSVWVVALEDGLIQAFEVVERDVTEILIEPESLYPGMPPIMRIQGGEVSILTVEDPDASSLTHPVFLESHGLLAYITRQGDLVLWSEGEWKRLELQALPDARILFNDTGDLLLLNQKTDRYGHGVLGDTLEAAAIAFVKVGLDSTDVLEVQIPEPAVIEGIAPIWVDMDEDGEREVIVTISDAQQGAQFVVFDERGRQVATSEPIGKGFRWRHQIAVAPLGTGAQMELVSVRTPHIGGVVEFHRWEGDDVELVASLSGYTTHVIGSRNLDMSVAGDFDGDGRVELLIPDQSLSRLAGLQRTGTGVEERWSLPLDGRLNTNLAVVSLSGMNLGVGAGMREGFLRLWLP